MSVVPNHRIERTREVKFTKDYAKGGRVIYRKGETHYIHMDVVEKLKLSEFGKVAEFKMKEEVEKAKKEQGIK